jgi:predicted ATPase
MPLVGREGELRLLREALGRALAGKGGLLLVAGEPGIGKTRLAEALAVEAAARGAAVARGAAWDGGGAPALWPWFEVLRALRPELSEPDKRLRSALGPLWEGADEPAAGPADPEVRHFRRLDALRAVLESAAAQRPLLVLLEDLHVADEATLEALLFLSRGLGEHRLLVLATLRDGVRGGAPGREALFSRLSQAGTAIRPGRLGRAEVAELLADLEPVRPDTVDEIHQRSGGNPLFVEELVRRVRAGGRPSDVPERVTAVIGERLARFEEPERAALEAAAVLGPEAPAAVLAEAIGVTVEEVRVLLAHPRGAGVIEPAGEERLRFAHPLYREHLLAALAPARAAAVHLGFPALLTDHPR